MLSRLDASAVGPGGTGTGGLMHDLGIFPGDLEAQADERRRDGATALFLAIDGRPAAVIAVADPIKPSTPQALESLRAAGIRTVLLTGDNRTTAEAVDRQLGITEADAEVLPEAKHQVIHRPNSAAYVLALWGHTENAHPAHA